MVRITVVVVAGKIYVTASWEQEHFRKIYKAAIIRTHLTTPQLGKTAIYSWPPETKPT